MPSFGRRQFEIHLIGIAQESGPCAFSTVSPAICASFSDISLGHTRRYEIGVYRKDVDIIDRALTGNYN